MKNDITLRCPEEVWDSLLIRRGNYFKLLSALLQECYKLVESFPDLFKEDFPPPYLQGTIEDVNPELLDSLFGEICGFYAKDDLEDHLNDFFSNGLDSLYKLEIEDKKSLSVLARYSYFLGEIFLEAPKYEDSRKHIFCISRRDVLAFACVGIAFGSIGYWKAKMKEKKRNFENVSTRTKKRLENIEKIEKLLEERDYKTDREFITTAMKETDRYERTVKEMIKEVIQKRIK